MSSPTITVSHHEDVHEINSVCGPMFRAGLYMDAEITYEVGQTRQALEAVQRLAADLRRQIADAAESTRGEEGQ